MKTKKYQNTIRHDVEKTCIIYIFTLQTLCFVKFACFCFGAASVSALIFDVVQFPE